MVIVGPNFNTGYLNGQEMVDRRYNFGWSAHSEFFEDAIKHERLWLGKGHWDRKVGTLPLRRLVPGINLIRFHDGDRSSQERLVIR